MDTMIEECEHTISALRADNEVLRGAAENAEGAAAALSAELAGLQAQVESTIKERDRLDAEASKLRSGLEGIQVGRTLGPQPLSQSFSNEMPLLALPAYSGPPSLPAAAQGRLLEYQRREGEIVRRERETSELHNGVLLQKKTLEAREQAMNRREAPLEST